MLKITLYLKRPVRSTRSQNEHQNEQIIQISKAMALFTQHSKN